jgi:hypothetical protein
MLIIVPNVGCKNMCFPDHSSSKDTTVHVLALTSPLLDFALFYRITVSGFLGLCIGEFLYIIKHVHYRTQYNSNTTEQRVLKDLYRRMLSRCRMIWLFQQPPSPLSRKPVVSLFQSSCVELTDRIEGVGDEPNTLRRESLVLYKSKIIQYSLLLTSLHTYLYFLAMAPGWRMGILLLSRAIPSFS